MAKFIRTRGRIRRFYSRHEIFLNRLFNGCFSLFVLQVYLLIQLMSLSFGVTITLLVMLVLSYALCGSYQARHPDYLIGITAWHRVRIPYLASMQAALLGGVQEVSAVVCGTAISFYMKEVYDRRMSTLCDKVYPFIKKVFEKQGSMYQNIAIPISDGRKQLTLSVNLEKAYNTQGKEIAKALSRAIILYQIDEHWKQHLREMDDLRTSVQNATYEQKDPLVVYKLESYNLFASMLEDLNKDVLSFLLRAFVPLRDDSEARPAQSPQRRTGINQMRASHDNLSTNGEQKANTPVHVDKKIGRNDPCPCGSGKKYKNCHGRNLT